MYISRSKPGSKPKLRSRYNIEAGISIKQDINIQEDIILRYYNRI